MAILLLDERGDATATPVVERIMADVNDSHNATLRRQLYYEMDMFVVQQVIMAMGPVSAWRFKRLCVNQAKEFPETAEFARKHVKDYEAVKRQAVEEFADRLEIEKVS